MPIFNFFKPKVQTTLARQEYNDCNAVSVWNGGKDRSLKSFNNYHQAILRYLLNDSIPSKPALFLKYADETFAFLQSNTKLTPKAKVEILSQFELCLVKALKISENNEEETQKLQKIVFKSDVLNFLYTTKKTIKNKREFDEYLDKVVNITKYPANDNDNTSELTEIVTTFLKDTNFKKHIENKIKDVKNCINNKFIPDNYRDIVGIRQVDNMLNKNFSDLELFDCDELPEVGEEENDLAGKVESHTSNIKVRKSEYSDESNIGKISTSNIKVRKSEYSDESNISVWDLQARQDDAKSIQSNPNPVPYVTPNCNQKKGGGKL
jgi:hypothetical protein